MNIDEIIDKIKFAIEMCGDGGPSPFRTEEINEMYAFLNAKKQPEHGCSQWCMGKEPKWKIGDFLANYKFTSDYDGEHFYGEIIEIEEDDEYGDWLYTFKDTDGDDVVVSEENLCDDKAYKVSKEYYEKHR